MSGAVVRERVRVPMPDGCELAALVRRPADADGPVPAIVEANPYRGGDVTYVHDAVRHDWWAAHGYATVRLDLRGTGDSDGAPADEYVAAEQDDICAALTWLADQPWCTGRVGMIGISWGGFAALQVAARRPPELACIVAVCATDDRWRDDVHYTGGALLARWALSWAVTMAAYDARPPDPAVVGDRWREMWEARLAAIPDHAGAWIGEQRAGPFWDHGSVACDYGAIACPVYLVGGWADAYPSPLLRLAEHLDVERKVLIGPWGHHYPDSGVPGPAVGFVEECTRWWDRWLRPGDEPAPDGEPAVRLWIQEPGEPRASHPDRPGRFVGLEAWPPPDAPLVLDLGPEAATVVRTPQTIGLAAGNWCHFGARRDAPDEQTVDDDRSVCLDAEPVAADHTVVGEPVVHLRLRADRPVALVAVRLCDVDPDGRSVLMSLGVEHLTRTGRTVAPLQPGELFDVTVPLRAVGYRLPAGHRPRVALSSTYWPWAWPPPDEATLTVEPGGCRLHLPVVAEPVEAPFPFDDVLAAPLPPVEVVERPSGQRRDREADGRVIRAAEFDRGLVRLVGHDIVLGEAGGEETAVSDGDPLSAGVSAWHRTVLARDGWSVATEARGRLTSSRDHFLVDVDVSVTEGDVERPVRSWLHEIPRDLL